MPRIVSASEKNKAIEMILAVDSNGEAVWGQRDIEKEIKLSRPYLRKLAKEIGFQFPRNGIEVTGKLCMCTNCGFMFRRPQSKVDRAKQQFCDEYCKKAWFKGPLHPHYKTGKNTKTFSTWVKNQSGWDKWRELVLTRDNNTCQISGRTDDLAVHHILPKAEGVSPEKVFDVSNGITVCQEVHDKIHKIIREGKGYEEAVEEVKKEYSTTVV